MVLYPIKTIALIEKTRDVPLLVRSWASSVVPGLRFPVSRGAVRRPAGGRSRPRHQRFFMRARILKKIQIPETANHTMPTPKRPW